MEPSPMGYFGKLPLEVRLPIWREIIASGSPAILQTSRAINDDISYPLYHTLNFSIYPEWDAPRLKMHLSLLDVDWVLQQRDGLRKRKRVWKLSYNKSLVEIDIFAPNTQDPGQIILLWKRVSDLVEMFNRARYDRKSIKIRLHPFEGNDWHRDGVPTQSIEYPGGVSRPDYQIVFLPFCRLIRARKIEVTAPSGGFNKPARHWRFVKYGCEFIMNDGYEKSNDGEYSRKRRYRDITRMFDNIDRMVIDTDFWLDTELDVLPGRTADMLRLDRFAHWFNGWQPCDSAYQRRFLWAIRDYPQLVTTHDKWLRKVRRRFKAFAYLYHTVAVTAFHYVDCDPEAWHRAHPRGIARITEQNVEHWRPWSLRRGSVWSGEYGPNNKPPPWEHVKVYGALRKTPSYGTIPVWPGHSRHFDMDIESFLWITTRRYYWKQRVRYLKSELTWCSECANAGFRVGCCRWKGPWSDEFVGYEKYPWLLIPDSYYSDEYEASLAAI